MADAKDKQAPAQWDDTGITQLDGFALVDPNPQTPYQAAACPVKELKGQREHLGGPPVDRVVEAWDQARDEAFAESSECQDLEYERTRFEAMDVKVENQAQRCKPRIYRVDTGTKKKPAARTRNPQLIPRVSIEALSVGPDGLAAPAVGKRANETRSFQPRRRRASSAPGCWATGNRRTPVPAGAPVSSGSAQATEAQGPGYRAVRPARPG